MTTSTPDLIARLVELRDRLQPHMKGGLLGGFVHVPFEPLHALVNSFDTLATRLAENALAIMPYLTDGQTPSKVNGWGFSNCLVGSWQSHAQACLGSDGC